MDLLLNDFLKLSEEEINNTKIEFNMTMGKGGPEAMDEWLKFTKKERQNGTGKKLSYWGWHDKKCTTRNFWPGKVVFSFVRIPNQPYRWLLISVAEVLKVPKWCHAEVKILKKYKPLFGRLIVEFNKGNKMGQYIFKYSSFMDKIFIKEIMPGLYSGEKFKGYDNVHLPFKKLDKVFSGEIMPGYQENLQCITGVYCLTDEKTGKLYIGSATGEGGVAQRWGNYLNSKHGGNKELIKLYKEKGDKYFEKYFTYTILEYFRINEDPEKVKERERYWKKCLDTVNHGYNDNY